LRIKDSLLHDQLEAENLIALMICIRRKIHKSIFLLQWDLQATYGESSAPNCQPANVSDSFSHRQSQDDVGVVVYLQDWWFSEIGNWKKLLNFQDESSTPTFPFNAILTSFSHKTKASSQAKPIIIVIP